MSARRLRLEATQDYDDPRRLPLSETTHTHNAPAPCWHACSPTALAGAVPPAPPV